MDFGLETFCWNSKRDTREGRKVIGWRNKTKIYICDRVRAVRSWLFFLLVLKVARCGTCPVVYAVLMQRGKTEQNDR